MHPQTGTWRPKIRLRQIYMRRLGANLMVTGASPFTEDDWSRIRAGEVALDVVKCCSRRVFTAVDNDMRALRALTT